MLIYLAILASISGHPELATPEMVRGIEIHAPRDPAGAWPESGCFEWEFHLDVNGAPYKLRALSTSKVHGLHLAMRSGLSQFRFRVPGEVDEEASYRIYLRYKEGNSSVDVVDSCAHSEV